MPKYDVIRPCFRGGVYRKPDDPKHNVVVTDKPLKPVPRSLRLRDEKPTSDKYAKIETKRQRTARLKQEAKAAEEAEKLAAEEAEKLAAEEAEKLAAEEAEKLAAEEAEKDKETAEAVTFAADAAEESGAPNAAGSSVTTI